MSSAACFVRNDTNWGGDVVTYNGSDHIHWICHSEYQLGPGQTVKVFAAPDWRGLHVKVRLHGHGESGVHLIGNGQTISIVHDRNGQDGWRVQ